MKIFETKYESCDCDFSKGCKVKFNNKEKVVITCEKREAQEAIKKHMSLLPFGINENDKYYCFFGGDTGTDGCLGYVFSFEA